MVRVRPTRPEPLSRWLEDVVRLPRGLSAEPGPIRLIEKAKWDRQADTCRPRTDGLYTAALTSGEDFVLSKEHNMKTRWALLSAAIFLGFLSSQVTAAEGVLGQGNISCDSWIESRGDDNPLATARTAWVLGFVTAFNQYRSRPEGDVSGGKDTEGLMVRIDDHCKRHPLDNLYKASAALVDELRQ
jgi:hypothetical protein